MFSMNDELIAPCGMNCALCSGYLAFNHDIKKKGIRMPYCAGCRPRDKQCAFLKKKCERLLDGQVRYCYECPEYPCRRLKHIDERYRKYYRMSMIENLGYIKENGIRKFLSREEAKWECPDCGDTVCCHNGICFNCGTDALRSRKNLYRWEDDT